MINFQDGMGPRQSIANEIADTVFFAGINKIKSARGYSKKRLDKGDAYVIPFGLSSENFGAVVVHAPKNIEVKTSVNGAKSSSKFRNAYDVKRFLIRTFIM